MKSRWFLVLVAVLWLALFSGVSVPVAAATPTVKLVLGGTGATPWAIGNIAPGNSGTNTVALSNTGYRDGVVTIWISDIVNSEGVNPESETGDTAGPGELGDYLVFNVSGTNLSTDFTLPAKIDSFPQSSADTKHIYVNPLKALATVNLQWEWRLPPEAGNVVQGDKLSFTINHMLEEFPPLPSPPPPPPQGGVVAPQAIVGITKTGPSGVFVGSTGSYTMTVTNTGAVALNDVTVTDELPEGLSYQSSIPAGTVIGSKVMWTLGTLATGETKEIVVILNGVKAGAAVVSTAAVTTREGVSASRSLGVTVYKPEPPAPSSPKPPSPVPPRAAPANFEVRNLTVSPVQAKPGENISINCDVINTGGQSGEFTLRIDIPGLLQTSHLIKLEAGQTQAVGLMLVPSTPGTYQVDVGGVKDSFAIGPLPPVLPAPSGIQQVMSAWLTPANLAVIGAAALVCCIVIVIVGRRKYLYPTMHQKRVAELAGAIAREMNLSKKLVKMLLMVGIVHDRSSVVLPDRVAQTALQYHERLNGSGYPQKLAGDDILLEARILAVADTAETMSSPTPHRLVMGLTKALEEIKRNSSTHYDPEVIKAFVRLVDRGKFRFQTRYS